MTHAYPPPCSQYRFSVFTATYNRCGNLEKLYGDLCTQTFGDFEWVVVNDGSSDDTDKVMAGLIAENKLKIVYVSYAKNGGKHVAWREGLKRFSGRYVITADDDDPILPDALEIHDRHWARLEKDPDYAAFWEVRSRCVDPEGKLVGKPLPEPWFDSDYMEVNYKMRNNTEMVGSRKIEVLREEASVPPFLWEDKCSNFPESIRWIRAAKKYKTRFVPEVTRIYEANQCGLMTARSLRTCYNTLVGGYYMLKENRDLMIKYDFWGYVRALAGLGRLSLITRENLSGSGLNRLDMAVVNLSKSAFAVCRHVPGLRDKLGLSVGR